MQNELKYFKEIANEPKAKSIVSELESNISLAGDKIAMIETHVAKMREEDVHVAAGIKVS